MDQGAHLQLRTAVVFVLAVCPTRIMAEDGLEVIRAWGTQGSAPGQFASPNTIAVDSAGHVFVGDTGNYRIQKFDGDGSFLTSWGSYGQGPGRFEQISSIAVDQDGRILVTDLHNDSGPFVRRIQVFANDGAFLYQWTYGSSPGQGVGALTGIATDQRGFVYVVESSTNVMKLTHDGAFVRSWSGGPPQQGTFESLAADADGHVFLIHNSSIKKFDEFGNLLAAWGGPGAGNGQFAWPHDLDVDAFGNVYVTDSGNRRIQKFSNEGAFLATWSTETASNSDYPYSIAVNGFGSAYVLHQSNELVQQFVHLNFVGIFADPSETQSSPCLSLPPGQATTLDVVATTGSASADGITAAEFRIEVTNPTGYSFFFTPVPEVFSSSSPMDITPANPNDATGTTIFFPSCQPPALPRGAGDLVPLGTLTLFNFAGGPTDLLVKRKNPPDAPAMPDPRFLLCDTPFNTPVAMSLSEGNEIAFRFSVNTPSCEPRPSAPMQLTAALQPTTPQTVLLQWEEPTTGLISGYNLYRNVGFEAFERLNADLILENSFVHEVAGSTCYQVKAVDVVGREGPASNIACASPFAVQVLQLDSLEPAEDGAAGPVSTDPLPGGYLYQITVTGSFSLWPRSDWNPSTHSICGMPEQLPLTPSPSAENYWVGADPEVVFARPESPGGCVTSLPEHSELFQIDVGSGFSHIEPAGGVSWDAAPGHKYVYFVTGQDAPVRFRLLDSATSDNYGVLTIKVELANPTDAGARMTSGPRLVALPNVPDPFNPTTTIRFVLPEQSKVRVGILDVRGRLLRELLSGPQNAGYHAVHWNGRLGDGTSAPSGIYFARIVTESAVATEKLTLIK